jgi:hypothetical protein
MQNKKKSFRAHTGGSYFRKEDFPQPEILTVEEVREEEVKAPGKKAEIKWVLYFTGHSKGLVLNETNGKFMEKLTGSEFPEDWIGTAVEVYCDPTVMKGSERVGGIRLREPSEEAVPY